MWKDVSVQVAMPMRVTGEAFRRLFVEKLTELKEGRWIVGEQVYEEHTTSHRFDVAVGDAADPKFRVLRAVVELEAAMKEAGLL